MSQTADVAKLTRPQTEGVNALHLMNASGKLTRTLETELRQVMELALNHQAATLELDGVDVAVRVLPWGLPETGIHGYAPGGQYIELTVNPDNPHFADCWRTELPATLAHELHHAKRWQGVGYGQTMLEVLVSEGLAQYYETSERGCLPPHAQVPVNIEALWGRAKPLLRTTDFGFEAWFYGSQAHDLPRWAGYALGYELVRRYFTLNGGDALAHVNMPAEAFQNVWILE